MTRKITHYFFTNKVGIVRVEDVYDGVLYYVKDVAGYSLEIDIFNVADWGNTFPKVAGDALLQNGFMTQYRNVQSKDKQITKSA